MKVYLTGEMSRGESLVNDVVDGEESKAVKAEKRAAATMMTAVSRRMS